MVKKLMKAGLMLGVNPNQKREENDFYATNPEALKIFLSQFKDELNTDIWECACGQGHLSKELILQGYNVYSSDLIDRGFGETKNFLECEDIFGGDILTNPPFKFAEQFVEKGINLIDDGNKLILFLKIQFLEGQKRKRLFEKYPLKYIYMSIVRDNNAP